MLTKHFGPVKAVTEVSMSADVGEVVGLIGENGAGKSTLLSMISGTLTPDSGTILLNGTADRAEELPRGDQARASSGSTSTRR